LIGGVTNIGTIGREYVDVSYKTFDQRGISHRKGTSNQAETTLEILVNREAIGQFILKIARESDNQYLFKIEYGNGELDFFAALVSSVSNLQGDGNTIRNLSANLVVDHKGIIEKNTTFFKDVPGLVSTFPLLSTIGVPSSKL